ncbi:MAG: hypothetical protein U0R49_03490 [Fimbriimonadales bacterium]
MRYRKLVFVTVSGAGCLPLMAYGQDIFGGSQKVEGAQSAQLGGQMAVDVMPGFRTGIGYPLRYAGVMRGSVRVEVDGAPLVEGRDYTIDYAGGVVYISAKVRSEQAIRVAYRHDPKAAQNQTGGGALPLLSLNFGAVGDIQMLLGMNGVNRMTDGSLMQSQMAGMKNSFNFAGGSLNGVLLVSSQSKSTVRADSSSPDQNASKQGVEGTDRLILQSYEDSVGDFKLKLDYQDVGKRFAGFGMLQSAGYNAATATQLEKEKGLQRFGLGMSAGNDKTLSVSNSFKAIQDGDSKIEWMGYNMKSSFFDAYFSSRTIDKDFTRFRDIAEGDRDQLSKEKGIDRQTMGGAMRFAQGMSLKFDQTKIGDANGDLVFKSLQYASPFLNIGYLDQSFGNGFGRARDLVENEREIWARQRGFERKDFTVSTPEKFKGPALSFSTREVADRNKDFSSSAFSVSHAGHAFEYWNRESEKGFGRLGDLPPGEIDSMIVQTLKAYDPNAGLNPNDRGAFPRQGGLNREFFRYTGTPAKGWGIRFDQTSISEGTNGIDRTTLSLNSSLFNFNYRGMDYDAQFGRAGDLMEMERNLFGQQIGFKRSDWSFDTKLGKTGSMAFSNLDVDSAQGGANRFTGQYISPQAEIRAAFRSVDSTFSRAGSVVDPEAAVFGALVGYNQHDVSFKLNSIKNLKFEGLVYGSDNKSRGEGRDRDRIAMSYDFNKKTNLSVTSDRQHFDGRNGAIYHNDFLSTQLFQDLGKYGKLTLRNETEEILGSSADRPSRDTQYLKYESQISKSLGIGTEQARTQFADGGFENVQIYKADWKVTPKLTITGSDILIDRDGTKPDMNTYAYGFSYDFGNNLKIGYTHWRELNSVGLGKRNIRWDVSNGDYYGFDFGGFYDEKRIDNTRTTSLGNFHIANKKPFDFGPLSGIMVKLGLDAQSDNQVIQKENKLADFSAKLFGAEIGASYAHVILAGEHIGADRIFRVNLDPTGKKPFQAKMQYKVRTLPGDKNFVIRNYDLGYKIANNVSLTHQATTLPEQANGGVPLGSQLLPTGTTNWQLDYKANKGTGVQFAFSELFNWQQRTLARKLEAGISLFADSGSPLRLKYGIENAEPAPGQRRTRTVYEISFDQRPGPNQVLSFAIGTVNWSDLLPTTGPATNITLRVDYQLKF